MSTLIIIYIILLICVVLYLIFSEESGHVPGVKFFIGLLFFAFTVIYWLTILIVSLIF